MYRLALLHSDLNSNLPYKVKTRECDNLSHDSTANSHYLLNA